SPGCRSPPPRSRPTSSPGRRDAPSCCSTCRFLRSFAPLGRGRLLWSAIAAVPLQNLDLVAVGILDEKELGHQRAVAMEFLDRIGIESAPAHPPMFAVHIRDSNCDVSISVAMGVWLGAAVIPRQLDLEVVLGIAQIDQREAVEIEPV